MGGKGGSDFHQMARHGEIVAACDISQKKLDYALRDFPFAAKFSDYREMISQMGDQIDLLSISTPDHTHAHAAQLAINQGIHLFVQAPLAHNIWEVRQLIKGSNQKVSVPNWDFKGLLPMNFVRRLSIYDRVHWGKF